MAKYVMMVQSEPTAGREDDYNKWYDEIHMGDVRALPGITAARRFKLALAPGQPGLPYISIFDLDVEDPMTVVGALGEAVASGKMEMSDAINLETSVMWIYKQSYEV